MTTKLTPNEKIVLAAYLAGANFGYTGPDRATVQNTLSIAPSLRQAVDKLWQSKFSADEPPKNFYNEANWWHKDNLIGFTRERVAQIWPETAKKFF